MGEAEGVPRMGVGVKRARAGLAAGLHYAATDRRPVEHVTPHSNKLPGCTYRGYLETGTLGCRTMHSRLSLLPRWAHIILTPREIKLLGFYFALLKDV